MLLEVSVKTVVWLSYDLGAKGDYDGLYSWLDNHKAKECGDSIAYIPWEGFGSKEEEEEDYEIS